MGMISSVLCASQIPMTSEIYQFDGAPRTRWGGAPATLLRKVPQVEESEDHLPVYTLTFATPDSQSFLKDKKTGANFSIPMGDVVKVCVPGYKPKSYSVSAERPGEFDITVKVYPGGRASGFLDRCPVGGSIDVFGLGKGKRRTPGSHVGFIAYGVGITEALPIAASELQQPEVESVLLLWASRSWGDVFWHELIAELKEKYGERFQARTILSREQRQGSLEGRVNPEVLSEVFDGTWGTGPGGSNEEKRDGVRFLSVGTKDMMKDTDNMLGKIGYQGGGYSGPYALLQ